MDPEPRKTTTRWWPLGMLLVLAGSAIAWLKLTDGASEQRANMVCMAIAIAAVLLSLLWLLAWSRMPWPRRLRALGGLVVLVGVFVAAFRFEGVSGNLVPIFVGRWRAAAPVLAAPAAPKRVSEAAVPGLVDFPQFFGPRRLGKLTGPELARDFAAQPPEELWRREVGPSWSGFAVAGRRAITQEQHGEEEAAVCYETLTGEVLWVRRVRARYDNSLAGLGPRATPTIDGDAVFVAGSTGVLECLELATGKVRWSKNVLEEHGVPVPEWGFACSPLVHGPVVVVNPGGDGSALVACDKKTGEPVWRGGDARAHYASPVFTAELAGEPQILNFHGAGVTGHRAKDGRVLWTYPWKQGHPHVALPVVCSGDRVCISSGYGTGCHLVQIERNEAGVFSASEVWSTRRLKAKFANFLEHDGYLFGLDDGVLACLELATGKRRWKRGRYGHGQILLVGDLLLVSTEDGAVVLVEPSPEAHREVTRFQPLADKTWNPPALAGRYLLVRNAREAACYRMPVAK